MIKLFNIHKKSGRLYGLPVIINFQNLLFVWEFRLIKEYRTTNLDIACCNESKEYSE